MMTGTEKLSVMRGLWVDGDAATPDQIATTWAGEYLPNRVCGDNVCPLCGAGLTGRRGVLSCAPCGVAAMRLDTAGRRETWAITVAGELFTVEY